MYWEYPRGRDLRSGYWRRGYPRAWACTSLFCPLKDKTTLVSVHREWMMEGGCKSEAERPWRLCTPGRRGEWLDWSDGHGGREVNIFEIDFEDGIDRTRWWVGGRGERRELTRMALWVLAWAAWSLQELSNRREDMKRNPLDGRWPLASRGLLCLGQIYWKKVIFLGLYEPGIMWLLFIYQNQTIFCQR